MKKSLLVVFALCCALYSKADYGVLVNDKMFYEASPVGEQDYQGRDQYKTSVSLNVGDKWCIYDETNKAKFVITMEAGTGSAKGNFTEGSEYATCKTAGCYDFYIKLKWEDNSMWVQAGSNCLETGRDITSGGEQGGEQGGSDDPKDYASAVPSQCTDVMLQAFYWDSNTDKGYGKTQWTDLNNQAAEIGKYFQLVWLPPSGYANAYTSSKLGYIPQRYSYQTSNMGMVGSLKTLISSLHKNGVKVLADIVINHCGNRSNACDFDEQDFGSFGKFSPTSKWITSNDEGQCDKGSNADDGQHDANFGAARDWDHKNAQVQAMCRAYLKWMKAEMKYDGFRFDKCGGYHVSHVKDYVTNAKPYFSVMEFWHGDANVLKSRIDETEKQTLTFDFANMYTALRDGIASGNYSKCTNAGLRGKGYSKYAVTFIDNHDTFNRPDDQNVSDVCGKKDGSSINNASVILQCNAYILSLPGVPCVFWPHWVRYKSDIQKMITARRMAGIHSESTMTETAGGNYYEATVQGKYGSVILYLGSSATKAAPAGYKEGAKGTGYAMYYTGNGPKEEEAIENTEAMRTAPATKVFRDGQMYIIRDGKTYTITGSEVR